jgi:hypothetical protein
MIEDTKNTKTKPKTTPKTNPNPKPKAPTKVDPEDQPKNVYANDKPFLSQAVTAPTIQVLLKSIVQLIL